jgi:4-nitrophenyl phosphatase
MSNSSAIVCDLDGVLFKDSTAIPGAGDALEALSAAGHQLVFATNNSTRTAMDVATRVSAVTGYATTPRQIVTSAMATAHYLAGTAESVFTIGEPGLVEALREAGINVRRSGDGVAAVVVGLDRTVTYEKLAVATLAVRSGARLVATNTDATFPSARGQVPGAGTFVAALERATGTTAEPCGKPHDPMAHLVQALVGECDVIMVGDRIETDIAFGRRHGWRTVLVLSGVSTYEQSLTSMADHVIDSIAGLPALLDAAG